MVAYHLTATQYLFVGTFDHLTIHLGLSLLLVFLTASGKSKRDSVIAGAGVALTLLSPGYMFIFSIDIQWRGQIPNTTDVVLGIILIMLIIDATRRTFGWVLSILAAVFVLYLFFGRFLPPPLEVRADPWDIVLGQLTMIGYSGIFGLVLGVSANFVFLFIVFGALLKVSGAIVFFSEVTKPMRARFSGGAALSAVTSSALIGMATGSPTANVAITGSFTIPFMKKVGYEAEQAGAIEAAASTGGQIMPPVMGAAAFIMAGMIGVPYFRIVAAAAIPAILYFFSIGIYAQLRAQKMGIHGVEEKIDVRETLLRAPLFIIPLGLIPFLLFKGYTPSFAVFWAIISIIALSMVRKATRPRWGEWVEGAIDGARARAQIGAVCALLGLIVTPMVMTGLGIKLPQLVEVLSGGKLAVLLLFTMVVVLLLGTGVPIMASYILVAMVVSPVLVRAGLDVLQSHMFVFYFAVLSFITPPVAAAVMVAAPIAGSSFIRTALEAMKAGIGGILA